MNCHETNYILDSKLPEELRIEQKQAVDRHFLSCRACREAWAAYHDVSALQIPQTPRDLHSRIAATIAQTPTRSRAVRRFGAVGAILFVGAAVAATVAFWLEDRAPEYALRLEGPNPVATSVSPASQTQAVSANGVEDTAGADRLNEPNDSTSSPNEFALDPNSIVIWPAADRELDPRHAELFAQFYEELLRQLYAVPGLNVVPAEVVEPFLGSGIPEEEITRGLGAAHLVVLSTSEPTLRLSITPVDAATGTPTGKMAFSPPFGARWPAELAPDVASVVEFIEKGLRTASATERSAAIEDARAIVLNAALPPAERAEALGRLLRTPDAPTDAIVAAAVELAMIAPALRPHIWLTMNGVNHPYLIDPLLDSLAYDANEYARRGAAAALRTFVAEPRVKTALARAQANDASEAVRERAQNALLNDEERNELALQTLLDRTLPARQRLFATSIRDGRMGRGVPLTDEAERAVFDIGSTSTDPGVRSMAWSRLGRNHVNNATFMSVLLDDLAKHPNDEVRSMAARALKQYVDDPAVRSALERAERDPSFNVRSAARSSLGTIPR